MTLLSKPAILRHMKEGTIIIDPFIDKNLKTASYDVMLGEYYFRPQTNVGGRRVFNPWNARDVKRVWGDRQRAKPLKEWLEEQRERDTGAVSGLEGIDPETHIIMIAPHEMLLCHTQEFIGGRRCVTTEMKARSSTGRVFLSVCKCAGWGDVGYFNRWTMEVSNSSDEYWMVLPVGYRFAQIAFYEVEPLEESYEGDGKYQASGELEELKRSWKPEMMLPAMWKDREAEEAIRLQNERDAETAIALDLLHHPVRQSRHGFAPPRRGLMSDSE